MFPMVAGLSLDRGWIKGIQTQEADHWIHLTRGLLCIGIILVPHSGYIVTVITLIILIGGVSGVSTFLRSSRKSSHLHSMEG